VHTIEIIIEIQDGIPTVTEVTGQPDTTVCIIFRDYDTNGAEPDELDKDVDGIPCFESINEYYTEPNRPGFT
jgi:hypothetical protein